MNQQRIEIGSLALLHCLQHIYLNALPPLYLLLRSDFNVSTLQIGLIGSISGVISMLQGPAGYLVERIGGKRLSVLSMIGCSAAVFAYSLAPSFEVLLILTAIFALAQVTFHPATYAMVVDRAATSHRGKYIAYHQVGGFIGSAVGTAVIASLAVSQGWRTTLQIIPVIGLGIILIFWKLVSESVTRPLPSSSPNPSLSSQKTFHMTTPLLVLILSISILSLGNLQQYIPLFLTEAYGETVAWAGILTSIMHAVGSISSLLGGAVSDKYDKSSVMISAHIGIALTTFLLAVGQFTSAILLFVLILYGVARYFPVPAQHALSSITAAGHPQGIGFSYTGLAIGQVFAAPLIGYLIDVLGARSAFFFCSIFPVISASILVIFKKIRKST
jgi:predicted MFS family arabinose efflux permease